MKTNIRELIEIAITLPEFEHFKEQIEQENIEELEALFGEANEVSALEYFNITFDPNTNEITFDEHKINFDQALDIVNKYLTKQEEEIKDSDCEKEVNEYDKFTKPKRGADDGTFDYAGTYVISILEILQIYLMRSYQK